MPHAADVTVAQALELLDGPFLSTATAIAKDKYAFWIGSGISLAKMPPLKDVVLLVLEHLQARLDLTDKNCRFRKTLNDILNLAKLSADERKSADITKPIRSWPIVNEITSRLVTDYARMLELVPDGEEDDYLLWTALDVVGTYGNPAIEPDVEHVCLGLLILEGVASDIASANWDGLIEKATEQLSGGPDMIRVIVDKSDIRLDETLADLYKFHGCAILPQKDEDKYRRLIVGTKSQIDGWLNQNENAVIANKLVTLVTQKPTFMLGLSAQDADIQGVFAKAENQMTWPWPSDPLAFVFSVNELGYDQASLLKNVYKAVMNAGNRAAINNSGVIQAFARKLLPALWLHVLCTKLCALVQASGFISDATKSDFVTALGALKVRAASACDPNDVATFLNEALLTVGNCLSLFRNGESITKGPGKYHPLYPQPVHKMLAEAGLDGSGLKEFAVAVGLLGLVVQSLGWALSLQTGAAGKVISISNGATGLDLYFAATPQSVARMMTAGTIAPDTEAVVLHSQEIPSTLRRHPRTPPGRIGRLGLREISIPELMIGGTESATLINSFRKQAAI